MQAPAPALPLRVLGRFASSLQAVLLALLHAGVAREQACLLQSRPELPVLLHERPRDSVSDGSRLPGYASTLHLDADVEAAERVGQPQRLQHHLLQPALSEVLHRALLVDQDPALTGLDADACDRRLAAPNGPDELLLRQPGCPPSRRT